MPYQTGNVLTHKKPHLSPSHTAYGLTGFARSRRPCETNTGVPTQTRIALSYLRLLNRNSRKRHADMHAFTARAGFQRDLAVMGVRNFAHDGEA